MFSLQFENVFINKVFIDQQFSLALDIRIIPTLKAQGCSRNGPW